LLARAKTLHLSRGQVELVPGMPLGHLDFPLTALLSTVVNYGDGNAREVGIVGREGFLPIEPVVGERRARRAVFCQIAGEAVRVPLESFERALATRGAFSDLIERFLGARLFAAEQLVACNLTHALLQRCARSLLTARDGVGTDTFPITHENLALMLGVRRPGVSEAIAQMQAAGAVHARRGEIRVVDAPALERFACECYPAMSEAVERVFDAAQRGGEPL
jgi:CRP-like cAMP-binding protein